MTLNDEPLRNLRFKGQIDASGIAAALESIAASAAQMRVAFQRAGEVVDAKITGLLRASVARPRGTCDTDCT